MIMYHGYEAYPEDAFELYDIENDPEELDDLMTKQSSVADELKNMLVRKFEAANKPFPE